MAGKQAGMVTGANAKIQVAGHTLAYAVDMQYVIRTDVIPLEVLGRVEVLSHEPISTSVRGSFTIARYTKQAVEVNTQITDSSPLGNGVKALGDSSTDATGKMGDAFNPQKVITTSTVDIVVYQRIPGKAGTSASDFSKFITISDCRLTQLSGSLNKRGILMEAYEFVGILYSDSDNEAGFTTVGADLS